MTNWSKIMRSISDCDEGKIIRLGDGKWRIALFAKQVIGHAGIVEVVTMSDMCMECRHMTKDGFVRSAVDLQGQHRE